MKINFNGAERKLLVAAISQELNAPAKYLRMPTAAYEVGEYHIDKNGMVTGPDNRELVAALGGKHNFQAVSEEYDAPLAATEETEDTPETPETEETEETPETEETEETPASEVFEPEYGAAKPDKSNLPRLYTLDTPRGEIYIAEEFATHGEAEAEGYGEYFSTALGTVYSYGDNRTFALVTSRKAGDWETTKIKRDFRETAADKDNGLEAEETLAFLGLGKERRDPIGENGIQASDVPDGYLSYHAEICDPDNPDHFEEFFSAKNDEEAIRQAYEGCDGVVRLLELHQLDENGDFVRSARTTCRLSRPKTRSCSLGLGEQLTQNIPPPTPRWSANSARRQKKRSGLRRRKRKSAAARNTPCVASCFP